MTWDGALTVTLVLVVILGVGMLGDYARTVDLRSPVARHLFAFIAALLLLFGSVAARRIFDLHGDWMPFWVFLGASFDVLLAGWWLTLRRSRRNGHR